MNRFACNSVTSEALRFTVTIEQFSMHVLKGYFISPEFKSQSSETRWSLVVGVNDGADYDNYIDVRLRRNGFRCEEQLVKAKVSIVGFPNLPLLTEENEKDLYFGEGRMDAQVLTVTKKRLFGYFGLNKLRLLPKDTLTLMCELVIHKYRVQTFDRRRDFENVAGHQGPARTDVKYLAHISMERETFHFVRRFTNFSAYRRSGRCVSPEFQNEHSDCKWSLVVNACDRDFMNDFFDIRLKRSDSNGNDDFVEVKLSIVDANNGISLSTVKQMYFRGSPDEELPIRTIANKDMSGWFRSRGSRLLPNDTLTLSCEITVFEESVISTKRKIDIQGAQHTRSHTYYGFPYTFMLCIYAIHLWFSRAFFILLPCLRSIIVLLSGMYKFGKSLMVEFCQKPFPVIVTSVKFCCEKLVVVITVAKYCKKVIPVAITVAKYCKKVIPVAITVAKYCKKVIAVVIVTCKKVFVIIRCRIKCAIKKLKQFKNEVLNESNHDDYNARLFGLFVFFGTLYYYKYVGAT